MKLVYFVLGLLFVGCVSEVNAPQEEGAIVNTIDLRGARLVNQEYMDVAVVINVNSPISIEVGNYFVSKRGIPRANRIYVKTSANETISDVEFQELLTQISSQLAQDTVVQYLVTTKGLPLRIDRGPAIDATSSCASLESELMLVNSKRYKGLIGGMGRNYSPYYYQSAKFSRRAYDMYLVTRLDGYTAEDVKKLIDRGGVRSTDARKARVVFDIAREWDSTSAGYLNAYLRQATSVLTGRLITELDTSSTFVQKRENVIGYVSWGSNDRNAPLKAMPRFNWLPGSIAETYVSTSARSFNYPTAYGQSLIADLIREGASGAKGYVYEPMSSSMANALILFDRYTSGYNLAESYFMASRYVSWMDVVIGDPKTRIILQ